MSLFIQLLLESKGTPPASCLSGKELLLSLAVTCTSKLCAFLCFQSFHEIIVPGIVLSIQAYQRGHTGNERTNLTPDMTTSLIQDYVPDKYERNTSSGRTPSSEVNRDSRLSSTPEDTPSRPDGPVDSYGEHAQVQGRKDYDVGNAPASLGAHVEADTPVQDAGEHDTMHWPSPDSGHGYTERRVNRHAGQGPAPFLTPGPHRGRMLG